jgi:DNA mismatch endonuclease, patch repair protein
MRYFVDRSPMASQRFRADLLFPTRKVAVFIDGCFFHGCPIHGNIPKRNTEFWTAKLASNRRRDRRVDAILRSEGWVVIRAWAHEDPTLVADDIEVV